MHRRVTPLVATTLALLALGSLARPARAEVIERVVAVVNDDAIFLSELRRRAAPYLERAMSVPSAAGRMAAIEQLYGEVLDRMVQEQLFTQAATEMQVSVTTAEVDRAIENVRVQSRLQEGQFWEAVRAQGFSPDQYRADVRRQLLRLKVLNNRARGRVNITEEQVRERYEMEVARARRTAQYRAAQLYFPIPDGATATEVADARRQAQAARDSISDADEFWAAGGQSLGRLAEGSLAGSLEDALMGLDVGDISGVVRGPTGFHVFLLEAREAATANIPAYEQVRMQIYQAMLGEAMERQEEIFVAELRRRAVVDLRL
ncbi:MAG: SurA N-terminal domain-containing protein [Sandaracinaceae bacterium]|nr:SurA N-terminal domain-containing protein [Sandaracinaceae bacterium]